MYPEKWKKYLGHAKQPPSLTSEDELRKIEAEYFITAATRGWDKSKKLLVLGCGDGYEVKLLRDLDWVVKGITFYKKEYAGVVKLGLQAHIIQCDIHELPFKDGEFDYVISKETLEHTISPFVALCEINRVMQKGARFVHYIPEGEEKQKEFYHYMCPPSWVWIDLMHKAGFEVSVSNQLDQKKYEGYKDRPIDL